MCKNSLRKKNSKYNRSKNSVELNDIFKLYASSYCKQHKLPIAQYKVINAICNCRSAVLGGNVKHCYYCGADIISYNSCRNRHCPKCQALAKARWLEAREAELLPVEYFHVVFTIPHELNSLANYNKTIIYNILFKAAWTTIYTLGKDQKRLDGLTGMLAALHTWGQNLSQHIHLHCIIPGGALNNDEKDGQNKQKWIPCKPKFLFPIKVMSKIFRGPFIKLLRQAYQNNELKLQNTIANLVNPKIFTRLLDNLMKKDWVVYSKKPFNGAKGAIGYLAKYVYKTAISNNRILSCKNDKVTFKWRDYSNHNKIKLMTLDAHEFIRRFLSHVLPDRFVRIRSFGFLANPCKKNKIQKILHLLNQPNHNQLNKPNKSNKLTRSIEKIKKNESTSALMLRLTGININICPKCKTGVLHIIQNFPNSIQHKRLNYQDTS
jgi:hypothetical protein